MPTKAVIAAAGLGTRFLPQTKAMPKEMLPVIDKPVIQLIVEEAVAAGVTDIIIVGGATKRSIEDHFDRSLNLENDLRAKGKTAAADNLYRISELANFIYLRQKGLPAGNARPVLNAEPLIDDEPFFVFFADDFFRARVPRAKQLLDVYQKTGRSVISLIKVDHSDADKYGMADIDFTPNQRTFRIKKLIEKPGAAKTPSDFASVSGYLLTKEIWPILESLRPGKGGELVLLDAINRLAQTGEVYGKLIDGVWHDTGDPLKYLQALVDMALHDHRYAGRFRDFLKNYQD